MKNKNLRKLRITIIVMLLFIVWTIAITQIDLQTAGPEGSVVGFSSFNVAFHKWTGVHLWLYEITDWLGLVPIGFVFGFGMAGFVQLIKRKNLLKVDSDILILGIFYIGVAIAYLLFESFAINYRPVLIDGYLEASYPSSTTLLVLCVITTSIMQINNRMRNSPLKKAIIVISSIFMAFMVIGRAVSGVHWITDIIGGILLSTTLVMMYYTAVSSVNTEGRKHGI